MHPHCPAVPWMPRIVDVMGVSNMGVVLLSCTISRGITRAKETSYSFPPRRQNGTAEQYAVESDSAARFAITAEPREYFGPSASSEGWHVQWEAVPPGEKS